MRVRVRRQQCGQTLAPARELFGRMCHHVDEQHGFGARVLGGLGAIVDGADVFLVEVLEGLQRLLAAVGELLGDVEDHAGRFVHAFAEEFQTRGQGLGIGAVKDEFGRRDDAVGAFLLQAGHAAQGLVGDVLPQVGFADLVAAQGDGCIQRAVARRHGEAHLVVGLDLA